jgi:aspartate kinase
MKVMKFGGGCLTNAEGFDRVAKIIQSEKNVPFVVVSAISGVTDLLIQSIQNGRENEKGISGSIESLRKIHRSLAEGMIRSAKLNQQFSHKLETTLGRIEKIITGIAYIGEATPAARNHVLSFGERLAASLLSTVLEDRGMRACALETDKIGLITDNNFENATADLDLFRKNFRKIIRQTGKDNTIPVITGFFGVSESGKISTFGRNGSDYSASVVANAVRATVLEIWKDVDGFMSADPKILKSAQRIDRLSYYEAAELSYFGAKILHPRALEPLAGMKISVRIKNLYDPKRPGTEIMPDGIERKDVIKSVTCNRQIAMLRIHGPGVGYKPGIIGRIGQRLADRGINIFSVLTSQTCINLLVDKKDARRSYRELREMEGGVIGRIDLEEDIALIAAVGEGILNRRGLAARIFTSVSKAGVNVEMISTGASEVATYFVVRNADTERTIHALHREFFPKTDPSHKG